MKYYYDTPAAQKHADEWLEEGLGIAKTLSDKVLSEMLVTLITKVKGMEDPDLKVLACYGIRDLVQEIIAEQVEKLN